VEEKYPQQYYGPRLIPPKNKGFYFIETVETVLFEI
jgi:hypothetical protein